MTTILSPEARTPVTEAVERMPAVYDDDAGLLLRGAEREPALKGTLDTAPGLLTLGRDPGRSGWWTRRRARSSSTRARSGTARLLPPRA